MRCPCRCALPGHCRARRPLAAVAPGPRSLIQFAPARRAGRVLGCARVVRAGARLRFRSARVFAPRPAARLFAGAAAVAFPRPCRVSARLPGPVPASLLFCSLAPAPGERHLRPAVSDLAFACVPVPESGRPANRPGALSKPDTRARATLRAAFGCRPPGPGPGPASLRLIQIRKAAPDCQKLPQHPSVKGKQVARRDP